jgi:hypothetical protein
MSLSSEEMNRVFVAASTGAKNPISGAEADKLYQDIKVDISNFDRPMMAEPLNEWADDSYDELLDATEKAWGEYGNKVWDNDMTKGQYRVTKQTGEQKYTLGAMYIPNQVDAHGEWTDSDELQKAVWDYVRSGNRDIRLQHDRDIVAGEWVEVMQLPYPLETPVIRPDGVEEMHTYPAGTVFLGVIWKDWAWELVKMGKILGYSIGGKAERMFVDMEKDMTVNDVHVPTIMNPKPKKKKDDKR